MGKKCKKIEKRQSYGQKMKKSAKKLLNGRINVIMEKKGKKIEKQQTLSTTFADSDEKEDVKK